MSSALNSPSSKVMLKPGFGRKLLFTGGGLAAVYALIAFSPYQMKMTISESVEHSVFLIKKGNKGQFERGAYVSVKSPTRPESGDEYVKIVAGLPGDKVEVVGRDIYVAGIHRGRAKELSLSGRKLDIIKSGIIPEGHIYIFAPHKDSHDSRYSEIGFVPFSFIIGKAKVVV